MTDVTLRLVCDHAAAPRFGAVLGAGWARVSVWMPPLAAQADSAAWAATLQAALNGAWAMLLGGAPPAPLTLHPARVEGPDAPADAAALANLVTLTWSAITGRATLQGGGGASLPGFHPPGVCGSPAAGAPGTAASPAAPGGATGAVPPVAEPALPVAPVPPAGLRAPRGETGAAQAAREPPGKPDPRLVEETLATVQRYIEQYGAAPDFRAERPAAREKAYNYIRSTAALQSAPDGLVEAVRRRLAGA